MRFSGLSTGYSLLEKLARAACCTDTVALEHPTTRQDQDQTQCAQSDDQVRILT